MCMYASYYGRPTKVVVPSDEKKRRKREISIKSMVQNLYSPVSEKYEKWEAAHFNKIMFFEKQGNKKYTGYCECGATVPLTSARSARVIECPVCKSKVRLTKNKYSTITQENCFALLDCLGDGWIQRLFVTDKTTCMENGAINVRIKRNEEERSFFDGNAIWFFHPKMYDANSWVPGYARAHGMGWYAWRVCNQLLNTYPYNLSDIFKGSKYQYSALDLAAKAHKVNPFEYLRLYSREPKLELLYKIGLNRVAHDIYHDDYSTTRIMDTVKSLKDLGIDSKDEIAECRGLTAEQLIARKEVKKWKIDKNDYDAAISFVKTLNKRSGTDFYYDFITRERWFKYALVQEKERDYATIGNFISDYIDYISDCCKLGLDLNNTAIKMPKSLKTAHKWARDEIKIQETQVYDALIESAYESMHRLVEWSNDKFSIIMPKTSREIVTEGVRQSHCVGRYCERVATGESVILFLRQTADLEKNYYTMEIKKDMRQLDVVQCRGFENCDMTPEIEAFIQKYEKWFNRRSLGNYNADNVMVKYFKAVHKTDGKYISNYDHKTEFKIGEWSETEVNTDSDSVAVEGLHVASMEFAQSFGERWNDVAILEVETNIHDVIIPDAKDQVRTSKFRVVREVPFEEMGEWGAKRIPKLKTEAA